MTNAEVISLAVANPLVRERHRNSDGSDPSLALLEGLAQSELQNEINSLLDHASIRRFVLGGDYDITLSTGTAVDQGTRFELKSYVASVLDITIGDDHRPLDKIESRVDFNRWWYERGGASDSDTADCWTPWDRSSDGDIRILISPDTGANTTATVHYIRKVSQPVDIAILPGDIHDLVLLGVINRMVGFVIQRSYDRRLTRVVKRLDPMKGAASPMPASKDQRAFNYRMSIEASGPMTSDNPLYISRRR